MPGADAETGNGEALFWRGCLLKMRKNHKPCLENHDINKNAVLILVNHEVVIYNFRLELVEQLLEAGYEVHISSPYGERIDELRAIGAVCHDIRIDRHGMNPKDEIEIFNSYRKLIRNICPVIVLGYTIKPNIYGAMASRITHVPFVANITGLGMAVENGGWKQKIAIMLYKAAFTKVQCVFFQNRENMRFFLRKGITNGRHILLPGSGVNLERYQVTPLPFCSNGKKGEPVRFAFVSRIMKEKGIDQYLAAAEEITARFLAVEFHVCGFCEDEYEGKLKELSTKGVVIYHGMIRNVADLMSQVHCIIHPTYYPEGMSNVLLESCACGRAIITTNRSGCREIVRDGVNGYIVPEKNTEALVGVIERFMSLSQNEKERMGLEGRKLVEKKYDRQIVVNAYMDEVHIAERKRRK